MESCAYSGHYRKPRHLDGPIFVKQSPSFFIKENGNPADHRQVLK